MKGVRHWFNIYFFSLAEIQGRYDLMHSDGQGLQKRRRYIFNIVVQEITELACIDDIRSIIIHLKT